MNENDYVNKIRAALKSKKPSYETTNKKEIHVRCPYCGDSRHDPSKARFYIQMKPPFKFHCFKCETSGVLNQQVMRDLGIFNSEIGIDIIEANKSLKQNRPTQKLSQKVLRNLVSEPLDSDLVFRTTAYFNNRYHSNFTSEEIQKKFKAVLDIIKFAELNHIYLPKNVFDFNQAIGFISSDKSHIILRDISGMQKLRYFNLALVSNEDELTMSSKIYNMSSEISVLEEEITLVICEGIFDIIGVYNAFYANQDTSKMIFAAACGKAYMAVIQHFIRLGFLNLNIVIYSDGDVNAQFYRDMKQSSSYLKNNKLTIYYNSLYDPRTKFGKDFGVPKDQIGLKKVIV